MLRSRTVLFLHIPKTGGTTLRKTCIYDMFRSHERYRGEPYLGKEWLHSGIYYYPLGFYHQNADLSTPDPVKHALGRKDIRAVTGHFCFGIHRYLTGPSTYITLLRNPLERIVSLYYHIRRWGHPELHGQIVSQDLSLEAFVNQCPLAELNNDQTRRISGIEPESGYRSNIALSKAKQHLSKQFLIVGVTESFDETLLLLKHKFGWNRDLFYYPKHVNRHRPSLQDLSQSCIDAIQGRNELDIKLHAFAKQLLDEAISYQDSDFYAEVERFKFLNARYISALKENKTREKT